MFIYISGPSGLVVAANMFIVILHIDRDLARRLSSHSYARNVKGGQYSIKRMEACKGVNTKSSRAYAVLCCLIQSI